MKWPLYNTRKAMALRWRARRAFRVLTARQLNLSAIQAARVICFVCMRNEALRLPYFLDHHRRLGVDHFIIVDNDSNDGGLDDLSQNADISIFHTTASYRDARFGMDWINALLSRYGVQKWCLTLDVDELLVFDGMERGLHELTHMLDRIRQRAFGALMVELYANAPIDAVEYAPGQDPRTVLNWFDDDPYWQRRKSPMQNLVLQGGPRARVFFAGATEKSPTLNKVPLIKWKKGDVYVNSTHAVLPALLNLAYDGPQTPVAGALLHTKFLPDAPQRAQVEQLRGQHFETPARFDDYYGAVQKGPNLWHPGALAYRTEQDLIKAGLMPAIKWGVI